MLAFSRSPRRILALWFPHLAADRLQRRRKQQALPAGSAPEPPPLVIAAKVGNALRLSAMDRKAAALGLAAGQPLANARAMLPALEVVAADEPADLALLGHIAVWCDRFTPLVALDGRHGLLLDVTGTSHLFGGERALLAAVCKGLGAKGFAVQAALAGTAAAARALACWCDGAVIAPGEEARAVAPLPVAALGLDPAITHAFRRAGLKTVGQAAGRQRSEIAARFGAATVAALEEALGHAGRPISPRRPPPDYWQEQRFAEPIATDAAIRAALKFLATALSRQLERHGAGARRLEAAFFRADGAVRRIAIDMGAPTRDPEVAGRLFRERLDSLADRLDPGFGFDLIRLSATRTERSAAAAAALSAEAGEKQDIGFLVDRLAARFGRRRILAFQPGGTHIPEAAWKTMPAQQALPLPFRDPGRRAGEAPRRPLRLFVRPEPVSVLAPLPEPARLGWRKAQRMIVHCEGPERIAMEWWRHPEPQPTRDYFRFEDGEGRRYWLYRNGIGGREVEAPQWFLHGVFA